MGERGQALALGLLAGLCVLAMTPRAIADCVDLPNLLDELPRELVTANQTRLAFSYDLENSEYSVLVSRGRNSHLYDGLELPRNCHPGTVRWENDDFVLLEHGCGTFCWAVDVLGASARRRLTIPQPIEFVAERNLVVSYSGWDTIAVTSLGTGHEQSIATDRHCPSSAEICFEARVEGASLVYVWQDGDGYAVPLDRELFHNDPVL